MQVAAAGGSAAEDMAAAGDGGASALVPPPAPAQRWRRQSDWGGLSVDLLLLALHSLDHADLAAAHLVARGWRDAVRQATRQLSFSRRVPDTEQLKLTFPNLRELCLERMQLSKHNLACVASLPRLTALALRMCRLTESGAVAALQRLAGLQELELTEVLGPTSEELDNTIRSLVNLHRLHVESRSGTAPAPSLRSLAFLPRIRQLSVKQARSRHGFAGLTNLGSLKDLQSLELLGATVTNSIMRRLAELTGLTQLRAPEASLVTNHGLEVLAGLTALRDLDLSCWRLQADGPVNDVGASHLQPLTHLTALSLGGRSPLTASGLAYLGRFTGLQLLDVSRVQMDQGSPDFLWQLTQLTCLKVACTKMTAAQFNGLPSLHLLARLDAGGTQFDDTCCAHLAAARDLVHLNLADTRVAGAGVRALCASHPGQLAHLQLDGCHVAPTAVLCALRRQPRGVCLWSPTLRGYLPRWVNVVNTLLLASAPSGRQRLRLRYAPEDTWCRHAAMCAVVAAVFVGHAVVMLGTIILLMLLPLAGVFLGAALLLLSAAGRGPPPGSVMRAASQGELYLSAVLVGVLSVQVPPPPPLAEQVPW